MKTIITYKSLTIVILLLFAASGLKAQQKQANINRIASALSVSTEKAGQIRSAMSYNSDKLLDIIKKQGITQAQRQRLIEQLYAERTRKIDSVLTPQMKATLQRESNKAKADTTKNPKG